MHQGFNALQLVVRGTDLAIQIASSGNIVAHVASWVIHAGVEASRRAYVQYRSVLVLTFSVKSLTNPSHAVPTNTWTT